MVVQRAARLLAMLTLPGVGPATVYRELKERGSAHAAYAALGRARGATRLLDEALPACEAAVARAVDAGLQVVTPLDPGYPAVLADEHLPPPPVLFVRGRLPAQLLVPHVVDLASVGVVGTRRATQLGLAEARALGSALAAAGAVVVSGLALGIDGAAHRGALDAMERDPGAAPTVAVLGGAHDRLHPKAHGSLAEAIVAAGGAVVSEHPPGTDPQPHLFLRRNRLIVGLSRVLVVVEAGERSGALNTAWHAGNVGRDVLTVPARPTDRRRLGNLLLLRRGARPLIDLSDVAVHLSSSGSVADALTALAESSGGVRAAVPASGSAPTGARPPEAPSAASGPTREGSGAGIGQNGLYDGPASRPRPSGPAVDARASSRPLGRGCLRALAVLTREGEASFDGLLARLTRSGRRARPTPAELAGCLVRLELAGCVVRGEDGRYRPRKALRRV